jgi:Leucine-rich repeat (LRR) protein
MQNSDDFFIADDDWGFGQCMVLKAPWRDEFANIMRIQGLTVLRLSSSVGWKETDISFVADLDFLAGIEVYNWDVKDVSPIFRNTGLRYVGLACLFTSKAEFQRLKNLEACFIRWHPKISGLESCTNLRHLNIENYPFESLVELASLTKMERLDLLSRKLTSLRGIEAMTKLKRFGSFSCTQLSDILPLLACTNLEKIKFEACKKLASLPSLMQLENLTNIALADCGRIETLTPLADCKSLQELNFIGDTSINDGNLDFLLEHPSIQNVWYANRKHYSMTREELAERLKNK